MKNHYLVTLSGLLIGLTTLAVSGCGGGNTSAPQSAVAKPYDAAHLLSGEPISGALEITDARQSAADKQPIVVVGRIGGSRDPWVKGRAAFSVVDRSLKACSDKNENGEVCDCPTPWDYCCSTDQLKASTVLVKFVEPDGQPVKHDAREIFSLKELQTVIVEGEAQRDESGNLTVVASKMFVQP